jgi:hypothetical protein
VKKAKYEVKITFLMPFLGTQSTRGRMEDVAEARGFERPEDEADMLPEPQEERVITTFYRDTDGQPILLNMQLKGFFKNAGQVLNGRDGLPRALRSKVNNLVFVRPRKLRLHTADGDEDVLPLVTELERPLRADTARGPRVAIARSEMLPEGLWFKAELIVLPGDIDEHVLSELLDYGQYQGLLQWRNADYGSFIYKLGKLSDS